MRLARGALLTTLSVALAGPHAAAFRIPALGGCIRPLAAGAAQCLPRQLRASAAPAEEAGQRQTYEVLFLRHGESEWNKERRFISWVDSPLTERGVEEAKAAGAVVRDAGIKVDVVYTSFLKRAIKTAWNVLEVSDQCHVLVLQRWRLNERFVGVLIGHTMDTAMEEFGKDKMRDWRATADIPPDPLDEGSKFNPAREEKYDFIPRAELPRTECLLDVRERVARCWDEEIVPAMRAGKRVAVVAHENSLRALLLHIDPNIPDDQILQFEVPRATPILYTFDAKTIKPIMAHDSVKPMAGRLLVGEGARANSRSDGSLLTTEGQQEVSMDAAAGFR